MPQMIPITVREEITAWYRAGGWTQKELAHAWGYSLAGVNKFLDPKERGSRPVPRGPKPINCGPVLGRAKLTAAQVREVRAAYKAFFDGWRQDLGIDATTLRNILTRRSW